MIDRLTLVSLDVFSRPCSGIFLICGFTGSISGRCLSLDPSLGYLSTSTYGLLGGVPKVPHGRGGEDDAGNPLRDDEMIPKGREHPESPGQAQRQRHRKEDGIGKELPLPAWDPSRLLRVQELQADSGPATSSLGASVPERMAKPRKIMTVEQQDECCKIWNRGVQKEAFCWIHPSINAPGFLTECGNWVLASLASGLPS